MNKLLNRTEDHNLYDNVLTKNLERDIEKKRAKLNISIDRNGDNINSREILDLSRELDELIVEYLRKTL